MYRIFLAVVNKLESIKGICACNTFETAFKNVWFLLLQS